MSALDSKLLKYILKCSDRYYSENLAACDTNALRSSWWEAFKFFLSFAYFQGRNDKLSEKFLRNAITILEAFFKNDSDRSQFDSLRNENWKPIEAKLSEANGQFSVGKKRDTQMILSALDRISAYSEDHNIVNYSVGQIRQGKLESHFTELQASQSTRGIVQVGPKIAAFYLRDLVFLFRLAELLGRDTLFCLQPVDVWVRRIVRKLGIVNGSGSVSDSEIQRAIVAICGESKEAALRFNQGAWYIGTNSLDLLLELADAPNTRID